MSWPERIEKSLIAGSVIIAAVSFWLVVLEPAARDWARYRVYQQGIRELKKIDYDCKLRDPTYSEMEKFLARDRTDSDEPGFFDLWDEFPCVHFSSNVKRNAIKEGIRCGGVLISFRWYRTSFDHGEGKVIFVGKNKIEHAIIAFQTVDKGVVFIEPQKDKEVKVAIGVPYTDGKTIGGIEIYWPK